MSLIQVRIQSPIDFPMDIFKTWYSLIRIEISHKGYEQTVSLFKEYHRVGTALALGASVQPLPRRRTIAGTNIPVAMAVLVPYLTGNSWQKRLALTCLNMYKLITLPPSSDLTAITSEGKELNPSIVKSFRKFIPKTIGILFKKEVPNPERYNMNLGYISSKNGPNGPSVKTFHKDTIALLRNTDMSMWVEEMLKISQPIIHENLIIARKEILNMSIYPTTYLLSKVSQLCEPGGKTRNIAIIDYWSQNALLWVHDIVMDTLRKIKTDATYNQEDGFKRVISLANRRGCCYSFDLSKATDRFPLRLQAYVVESMFGERVGYLWSNIIANRDFHSPYGVIRWAVGQPLGSLSSWGVFALTHHIFIRWCANNPLFSDYVILGDDVSIMNSSVARQYRDMMEEIGVEINDTKSYTCTGGVPFGEFAKRVFKGPDELSGLPIDILLASANSIYMIPDLITFLRNRWDVIQVSSELYAPSMFSSLSKKGRRFLEIILTFRNSMEAGISPGYPWCALGKDSKTFKSEVYEYYLDRYLKFIDTSFEKGSEYRDRLFFSKYLEPLSKLEGNHVSDVIMMLVRQRVHPITLIVMTVMAKLSNAQADCFENLNNLDNLIVEFVPDPHLRAMYYDRKTVRNMVVGKTAIELFYKEIKGICTSSGLSQPGGKTGL